MDQVEQQPVEETTQADLEAWYKAQEQLKQIKDLELSLRLKIFKDKFRTPEEGVNKFDLPDGYLLKGTHVINRGVDEAAFTTLRPLLTEQGIKVDELIKWKPELKIGEYRKLTEEERLKFDQLLVVKPGTPQLEIVLPKRKS